MEEKKLVSLSNDGLLNMQEKYERRSLTPFFSKETRTVKFKFKKLDGDKELIIKDPAEYNKYSTRLGEIINNNNSIKDGDKVFFSKNSDFPRTTFNRYSNKAKRIQSIEKADKIVINPNCLGQSRSMWHSYRTDKYIFILNPNELIKSIEDVTTENVSMGTCKYNKFIRGCTKNWGSFNWQDVDRIEKMILEDLKNDFELHDDLRHVNHYNIRDTESYKDLISGIPISKFVSDDAPNTYIDQFKDALDGSSYELIKSSLLGEPTQITLGLKLIENMNLTNSKAYLYCLFFEAGKNINNIKRNKVYKSIGITNMMKNYGLTDILDISGTNHPGQKLNLIEDLFIQKLSNKREKEIFLTIMNKPIHDELKSALGENVYNLILENEEFTF